MNASPNANNESSENYSIYMPLPIDEYSKKKRTDTTRWLRGICGIRNNSQGIAKLCQVCTPSVGRHDVYPTDPKESSIDTTLSTETVHSLFTTDAELVTFGTTGSVLANLYMSLALFREASGGNWIRRASTQIRKCGVWLFVGGQSRRYRWKARTFLFLTRLR